MESSHNHRCSISSSIFFSSSSNYSIRMIFRPVAFDWLNVYCKSVHTKYCIVIILCWPFFSYFLFQRNDQHWIHTICVIYSLWLQHQICVCVCAFFANAKQLLVMMIAVEEKEIEKDMENIEEKFSSCRRSNECCVNCSLL